MKLFLSCDGYSILLNGRFSKYLKKMFPNRAFVLSHAEMTSISRSFMHLWSFMSSQTSTWFRPSGKAASPLQLPSSGPLHSSPLLFKSRVMKSISPRAS